MALGNTSGPRAAAELVDKLAAGRGYAVCSADVSHGEVVKARTEGRLFVTPDGMGAVHYPADPPQAGKPARLLPRPRVGIPPAGRFPWPVRAFAAGLDHTAAEATFKETEVGAADMMTDPAWLFNLGRFMAYAFVSMHDRARCAELGLRPLESDAWPEIAGLTAFGWKLCEEAATLSDRLEAMKEREADVAAREVRAQADAGELERLRAGIREAAEDAGGYFLGEPANAHGHHVRGMLLDLLNPQTSAAPPAAEELEVAGG